MSDPDATTPTSSRNQLGDFLRSRRERLAPATAGPDHGRRRRTSGLRREEVAERAGIGIDWYIRLEQGRTVTPSSTTVDALAKALMLSRLEHQHLRTLAQNPNRSAFARETVPATILRMVKSLSHPAYITGRRWDVLAWNDAAVDLFTDFGRIPQDDRNILLYMLTVPEMKALFREAWADEVRRMLALFRITYDVWAGDPAFAHLLEQLRQGCPEFVDLWERHDVGSGAGVQKFLHHSTKGLLRFETASFQANDDPSLRLAIYTPL